MRKICILLALAISLCSFASCKAKTPAAASSTAANTQAFAPSTYGEIIADHPEDLSFTFGNNVYVMIYKINGRFYRSYSKLDEKKSKELNDVDVSEADSREKVIGLMKDYAINKTEDLSATMPSQDKVDSYTGKNGSELIDKEQVSVDYISQCDPVCIFINWGYFQYQVTFDAKVESEDSIEDTEQFFRNNKITKIEFINVSSNADNVEI